MKSLSVYLHIPFCKKKCYYCDFASFAKEDPKHEDYVKALCLEIEQAGKQYEDYWVDTIFIGGGTPSLLKAEQLEVIQTALAKAFKISDNAEISMECNPGTLTTDKIDVIAKGIINRVSLGLQTTDNELLDRIGRIHNYEVFKENYNNLRHAGINNINVDMMFGLPGQTIDGFIEGLEMVVDLSPDHIAAYGLIIEKGTPFHKMYHKGRLLLPEEEAERQMYEACKRTLEMKDYEHYEISNFAKPGYECRHNLVYWELKPYIGLGLAAHSFIDGYRYAHTRKLDAYIQQGLKGEFPRIEETVIDQKAMMEEYMFLGLRKLSGVNKKDFLETFHVSMEDIYGPALEKLLAENLIEIRGGQEVVLTHNGLNFANRVYSEFLL